MLVVDVDGHFGFFIYFFIRLIPLSIHCLITDPHIFVLLLQLLVAIFCIPTVLCIEYRLDTRPRPFCALHGISQISKYYFIIQSLKHSTCCNRNCWAQALIQSTLIRKITPRFFIWSTECTSDGVVGHTIRGTLNLQLDCGCKATRIFVAALTVVDT